MDKTRLVAEVVNLFSVTGHKTSTSVQINFREIDVVAEETQGLVRKIVLIECADYAEAVGIDKLTTDIRKLTTARDHLGQRAIIMHVSRAGYSSTARGYALEHGIDCYSINELTQRLVNFEAYIEAVEGESSREIILREYQPTAVHPENEPERKQKALAFLDQWLEEDEQWLTVLGDYGVGKSWMLKRFLYHLLDRYRQDPATFPLPFFVPLQHFTKAFDFRNLLLATFQRYGLGGVHYSAFEYLANTGRVVFLFDSFDEMAQNLGRNVLRENLKELLSAVDRGSRAIMTSRPTYFESRAERIVLIEESAHANTHSVDREAIATHTALARYITDRLEASNFARLNDLTVPQRIALFKTVLGEKPVAHRKLIDLFKRFQSLETISQRAVIARLLTTVAETLAGTEKELISADGLELLPDTLESLTEAKVFEIVVHNLLRRDVNVGLLSAADRLRFLRTFAIYLQRPGQDFFAGPEEIKPLVRDLFDRQLQATDTPVQLLENYYRTCRRHSGLTTEGQFLDTTGNIDTPVDEADADSRVGFSHNSLREYLVADSIGDYLLRRVEYPSLFATAISDAVGGFLHDISCERPELTDLLAETYRQASDSIQREWLFSLIYQMMQRNEGMLRLLGHPSIIDGIDLCNRDLSNLQLRSASIQHCIAADTDFRGADLRDVRFNGTILERAMFDGAQIAGADFREAEINSVFVYDAFERRTTAVLSGKSAKQWIHSKGGIVAGADDLNPYLGQPWYEAAREVTRTLERRIAGTHQDVSLVKGIDPQFRPFAWEFVRFLIRNNVIRRVKKLPKGTAGEWIVQVNQSHYRTVEDFSGRGYVGPQLKPFFDRFLQKQRQRKRN